MSDVERITARNHDRARMEEAFRRMQQRPPRRPRRRSGISLVLYVITGGLLAIGFAGLVLPGTNPDFIAAYLGLAAVVSRPVRDLRLPDGRKRNCRPQRRNL